MKSDLLFIALLTLVKKATLVNHSHRSLTNEQFTLFCQITSNSHEKPKKEFPTLPIWKCDSGMGRNLTDSRIANTAQEI